MTGVQTQFWELPDRLRGAAAPRADGSLTDEQQLGTGVISLLVAGQDTALGGTYATREPRLAP